jgi:zinc protease
MSRPAFSVARLLLLAWCWLFVLQVQAIPLDEPLQMDPALKTGELKNGLRYYLRRHPQPAGAVQLRLLVKAGSLHEDDDQLGGAHLLEHLIIAHSPDFDQKTLDGMKDALGLKTGADINGMTTFEHTTYQLEVSTRQPEHLQRALQLLASWARGTAATDEEIEHNKKIVLEELRMRQSGIDYLRILLPRSTNNARHVQRVPIGTVESLQAMTPAAIRRYAQDWYRPDLMALVVVGDIDVDAIEKQLEERFGALRNPATPRPAPDNAIPPRLQSQTLIYGRMPQPNLLLHYPLPLRAPLRLTGEVRATLIDSLVLSALNERYVSLAKNASSPFVSASAVIERTVSQSPERQLKLTARPGPAGAERALAALATEQTRLRQHGLTNEEFDRIRKRRAEQARRASLEFSSRPASAVVQECANHFFHGELVSSAADRKRLTEDLLGTISLPEVNRRASELLSANKPFMLIFQGHATSEHPLPEGKTLLRHLASAVDQVTEAPVQQTRAVSLMPQLPEPGSIVTRENEALPGLSRWTLSNGLQVWFRRTAKRDERIEVAAVRDSGFGRASDDDYSSIRYLVSASYAMGIGKLSPAQEAVILQEHGDARLAWSMGHEHERLSGKASRAELEMLFQSLHLRLTAFRRDEDLFKSFVEKAALQARDEMTNRNARIAHAVDEALWGSQRRAPRATQPDDYRNISLDRIATWQEARVRSAHGVSFLVVGDIDPQHLEPLVTRYLASLPVGPASESAAAPVVQPQRGVIKRELLSGREPKADLAWTFTGLAEGSPAVQLRLQVLAELLRERLRRGIRQEQALVYAASVSGGVIFLPNPVYRIDVRIPTAPASIGQVRDSLFAEIASLRNDGPNKAELDRVKEQLRNSYTTALDSNAGLINRYLALMLRGQPLSEMHIYPDRVAELTPEDLRAAARQYFDLNNYVYVAARPAQ